MVDSSPDSARTRTETICESDRSLEILLIDDNPMNQQSIGFMIDRMGHEVKVVGDAQSGIDAARQEYFDIILMDIHLPDMNGVEAAKHLRSNPGSSGMRPILAITSDAEPDHIASYKAAGMNGCVPKPVDNAQMARAFDEVMGETLHSIRQKVVPLTEAEIAREEADKAAAENRDENVAAFLASLGAAPSDDDS